MDQYMTLSEIAELWGADTRTIQNLCRHGKVQGAIKRAGSWFIPKDAPCPLKNNSRSGGKKYAFNGTKKKVFDTSIQLFSQNGFESVSLRDIGDAVGITQSTIYNHFASKQEILDTIYDFYEDNFFNKRIPIEDMKVLLKNGTKEQFCSALMFEFDLHDEVMWTRMSLITKIIYMRIYQDPRAQNIFLGIMNQDTEDYINEILEYGVSIGILREFDVAIYTKFLIGQRHIMGIKAFADPNYRLQPLEEEQYVMKMSTDMLPFVEE